MKCVWRTSEALSICAQVCGERLGRRPNQECVRPIMETALVADSAYGTTVNARTPDRSGTHRRSALGQLSMWTVMAMDGRRYVLGRGESCVSRSRVPFRTKSGCRSALRVVRRGRHPEQFSELTSNHAGSTSKQFGGYARLHLADALFTSAQTVTLPHVRITDTPT